MAGDVEVNPGPQYVTCPRCQQQFNRPPRLEAHLEKQVETSCNDCGQLFCSENRLQQHNRTDHVTTSGDGVSHFNLDEPLLPNTGYPETDGYKDAIEVNDNTIYTFHWDDERKYQSTQKSR